MKSAVLKQSGRKKVAMTLQKHSRMASHSFLWTDVYLRRISNIIIMIAPKCTACAFQKVTQTSKVFVYCIRRWPISEFSTVHKVFNYFKKVDWPTIRSLRDKHCNLIITAGRLPAYMLYGTIWEPQSILCLGTTICARTVDFQSRWTWNCWTFHVANGSIALRAGAVIGLMLNHNNRLAV